MENAEVIEVIQQQIDDVSHIIVHFSCMKPILVRPMVGVSPATAQRSNYFQRYSILCQELFESCYS